MQCVREIVILFLIAVAWCLFLWWVCEMSAELQLALVPDEQPPKGRRFVFSRISTTALGLPNSESKSKMVFVLYSKLGHGAGTKMSISLFCRTVHIFCSVFEIVFRSG